MNQTVDDRSLHAQSHVRPAHARALGPVKLVRAPIVDFLEIVNAGVVVVLSREDDGIQVPGMSVSNGVTIRVPATKT